VHPLHQTPPAVVVLVGRPVVTGAPPAGGTPPVPSTEERKRVAQAAFLGGEHLSLTVGEFRFWVHTHSEFLSVSQNASLREHVQTMLLLTEFGRERTPQIAPKPPTEGTLDPSRFSFVDFDGFVHMCSTSSTAALNTTCINHNLDAAFFRLLVCSDLERAAALVVVSTFTNPHVLYAPGFRQWLIFQVYLLPDERDLVLLNIHVCQAKLLDMGWLLEGNINLFREFGSFEFGHSAALSLQAHLMARFFAGTGSDREAEARTFDSNVSTMSNAQGVVIIENLLHCLCAVSLNPALWVVAERLRFFTLVRLEMDRRECVVVLYYIFRELARAMDLLRADHHLPGDPLRELFRDREKIPAWLISKLSEALSPPASHLGMHSRVRDSAITYFSGFAMGEKRKSSSGLSPKDAVTPANSHKGGLCYAAYFQKYFPDTLVTCASTECRFSHVFVSAAAHSDATFRYVSNLKSEAPLYPFRQRMLSALGSSDN